MPSLPQNGHATKAVIIPGANRMSGLAGKLNALLRADDVEIGCPDYVPSEEHNSLSWADLEQACDGIKWLVSGWVPYGMLTGIVAEPKVGKSAFALGALVRPIITAFPWFTLAPSGKPGNVIWCDTERSAAINVQRMRDWGLPSERIILPFHDEPFGSMDLDNADHMARLFNVVCHYKAKLVVVDSFRGAHKGDENSSKMAAVLQNLGSISERTKAAIPLIHHTGKMGSDQEMTINSGRGSNAYLAMVRSQIVIDIPNPTTPDRRNDWRRVQVLGENLGKAPQPIGYLITDTGLEFGLAPERPRRQTDKDKAVDWLRERLKPGMEYAAGEILEEAEQHGYSTRTIQKAATEKLGIVPRQSRKDGKIGIWVWVLPGGKS